MKTITFPNSITGEDIQLSYNDYGSGRPVVLIHGWPLSKEMWEYQLEPLVEAGLRVVKYDRRGFGKSSKPWDGYDYDTLAADLDQLMTQLDLRDAVLVGFSMGGGEVVRYLTNHGSKRVSKVVLISSVTPFLAQGPGNEAGADPAIFEKMIEEIREDRPMFLEEFGKKFFGVSMLSHPVSSALLNYYANLAAVAPNRATRLCVKSFAFTDFREDLMNIEVQALIIHGDSDQTVPIEVSGKRSAEMIKNNQYLVYSGAPHGLFYTHKDQLNQDLISFIKDRKVVVERPDPKATSVSLL